MKMFGVILLIANVFSAIINLSLAAFNGDLISLSIGIFNILVAIWLARILHRSYHEQH